MPYCGNTPLIHHPFRFELHLAPVVIASKSWCERVREILIAYMTPRWVKWFPSSFIGALRNYLFISPIFWQIHSSIARLMGYLALHVMFAPILPVRSQRAKKVAPLSPRTKTFAVGWFYTSTNIPQTFYPERYFFYGYVLAI